MLFFFINLQLYLGMQVHSKFAMDSKDNQESIRLKKNEQKKTSINPIEKGIESNEASTNGMNSSKKKQKSDTQLALEQIRGYIEPNQKNQKDTKPTARILNSRLYGKLRRIQAHR